MSHSGWVALWVTWAPGFEKRRKMLGREEGVFSCSAESILIICWWLLFKTRRLHYPRCNSLSLCTPITLLDSLETENQQRFSRTRDIIFEYFSHSLFSNPGVYITHNAPQATEWHHWRVLIRLDAAFSWARNDFTLPDYLTYSHLCPSDGHMQKKRVLPGLTSNPIRVKMQIINRNEKINHVLLRKYQLKTGSSLTVKCRGGRGSEREKGSGWTNGHTCLHLAELFQMRRRFLDCEQRFPPVFEPLDPKRGFNIRPDVFIWRSPPFREWWQTRSGRSLNKLSTVFNSCPNWHL